MSTRVLVIGLDMGDVDLVETWARDGTLPNLRTILAEGCWGRLETTAEVLHTSVWPTIFTGAGPGRHGVYYPYQPRPGEQTARLIGPDQYGVPPFWQALDRAGRRTIVFDAPETFPLEGYRGVQVFEWSTWAWYWRREVTPRALEAELADRFGNSPLTLEARRLGFGAPDPDALARQLLDSAGQKAQIARWLMRGRAWDLFLVVFAEPHPAGHYLWPRSHGPGPFEPDEQAVKGVRAVYAAVDAAIGEVLDGCPDDATVLVVSGDGVGPNRCGWHLLPEVLRRAGFTQAPTGPGRRSLLARLRDRVPPEARAALSARLPWRLRDRLVGRLATADVDWTRTVAFCLPTDLEGCIRVNLRGREPAGIVEPGAHFEAVCEEIAATLGELVNPATGERAVRRVWRTDACCPGERRHHLPDLVVTWASSADIRALHSDRLGLITGASGDPRPGTHYPRAFLAARGPRVRAGTLPAGAHLADVAPTVLAWLGVPAPPWMEGRVLTALTA